MLYLRHPFVISETPPLPGFRSLPTHPRTDLHGFTQSSQKLGPIRSACQGPVQSGPHLLCPTAKRRCVQKAKRGGAYIERCRRSLRTYQQAVTTADPIASPVKESRRGLGCISPAGTGNSLRGSWGREIAIASSEGQSQSSPQGFDG